MEYRKRRKNRVIFPMLVLSIVSVVWFFLGFHLGKQRGTESPSKQSRQAQLSQRDLEGGLQKILAGELGTQEEQETVIDMVATEKMLREMSAMTKTQDDSHLDSYHRMILAYVESVLRKHR